MKIRFTLSVAMAAAALALLGAGCNPMQSAQQAAADKLAGSLLSKASGGKVTVNSEGGQYTYKDNKSGAEMTIGENAQLPSDFPTDVPLYAGAKPTSVLVNKQDNTANITLTTDAATADVVKWYEGKFKADGWSEDQNTTVNSVEFRQYSKGSVKMTLSVWPNAEEGKKGTFITVNRSEEKQ